MIPPSHSQVTSGETSIRNSVGHGRVTQRWVSSETARSRSWKMSASLRACSPRGSLETALSACENAASPLLMIGSSGCVLAEMTTQMSWVSPASRPTVDSSEAPRFVSKKRPSGALEVDDG